jgi:preprotein translocase SecF subunit
VLDLISWRRYGYIVSGVVTAVSLVFIILTLIPGGNLGLRFSIAYTGGTIWEVHFDGETPSPADVRAVLDEHGLPGSEVAITSADGRDYVLIRTEALTLIDPQSPEAASAAASPGLPSPSPAAGDASSGASPATAATASTASPAALSPAPAASPAPEATPMTAPLAGTSSDGSSVAGVPTEGRFGELATALQDRFGRIDEVRQQNSVGPVVSNELVQQTFLLILFASLAIMLWITYRFRDLRMGVTAIVALLHDVIVTVGIFALLGTFIDLQIDALFVTAMLTVIGFSVHDTIVVFDRVRENRQRHVGDPMESIVNFSLMQTVGRSITTSLTIAVTLMALFLLGSEAIRSFTFALLVGVIVGAYSSIFVATPLFVDWYLRDERRRAQQTAQPSTA